MNRTLELCELPEIAILMNILNLANEEAYEHSISVAFLVEEMLEYGNEQLKFSKEEQDEILKGALLHDVGKAFLPLNISQLQRGLTTTEYEIVKIHANLSYEITKPVFSKTVQNICLYHHERANGTGYSQQLTLDKIPKSVLIVQVADIYDALTRQRSYKNPYEPTEALNIMKQEASDLLLDDEYVKILENVLKKDLFL